MENIITLFFRQDTAPIVVAIIGVFGFMMANIKKYNKKLIEVYEAQKIKGYQLEKIDKNEANITLIIGAVGSLLQYRFIAECSKIIEKGYMTFDDNELIDSLYRNYMAFGLNGAGKKLYREVVNLPIKK